MRIRSLGFLHKFKTDDRDREIMEGMMVGFVMVVIGKWSVVVIFAPEPAFYYLCVCMIKIIIKTNQIDMDVCFFQKYIHKRTMLVPKGWLFPLVRWFVSLTLMDKHGTKNL